jgi:phage-related protein
MAEQNYTEWSTGKDVQNATPDGTFNNVSYSLTCRVFLSDEAYDNSAIYNYLVNARTLSISRLTGYYFKVLKVSGIQPTVKYDGKVIGYKVNFTLSPFKYHLNNDPVEITQGTITNPGTRYSRPVYVISGLTSGTTAVTLTVNGQQFKLTGLTTSDGIITIDAEKLLCYWKANAASTSTVNLMPKSEGQIPFLNTGINTATVSDGTLTITGNWRSY